jgi:DNA polymerase III gamma/tau subunit
MDLDKKYRPSVLEEVIGNKAIINSIASLIKKGKIPHAFLFSSEIPGIGKTSLARILGNYLNASIIEVDGARYSGVADARELIEDLQYPAFGKDPIKFLIVDEVHRL